MISSIKTAGGHRRLSLDSVIEFLRASKRDPLHPELLGLPPSTGKGERTQGRVLDEYVAALSAGDDLRCRQLLLNLHLANHPASKIGDQTIAPAFQRIGDRWANHELEVYHERRACDICMRSLHELRALLRPPEAEAPLAAGGTPEWDPYTLPTTLVDIVLRQLGWRTEQLGSRLPFQSLIAAAESLRPRILWLSVSHLEDEAQFIREYRLFYERVSPLTAVVVGGRALTENVRRELSYAAYCDNLRHLETFVGSLAPV